MKQPADLARFEPWRPHMLPAEEERRVLNAVRALWTGNASQSQQVLLADWLQQITGTGLHENLSFRPGPEGQRATDFAEGKRWVGLQILKMLHPLAHQAIDAAIKREAGQYQRGRR